MRINVLNHASENYWDFKSAITPNLHKIAKYPAVMVAPMQGEIIRILIQKNPHYSRLLDPFHGSGVALAEGMSLGLKVFGIDINPYAHLITKVKLSKLDPTQTRAAIRLLFKAIEEDCKDDLHNFQNINKWFREDIIRDLSRIRRAISNIETGEIKNYFWLCLGEVARIYSNTRSSTFKLHIKAEENIYKLQNNVIKDFLTITSNNYLHLHQTGKFSLECGDSIRLLQGKEDESFDIICTSPPYGDNATTVTYGQFSNLQLRWIDLEDFGCSSSVLKTFSEIDSISLGGTKSDGIVESELPSLLSFVSTIHQSKRKKVRNFFADYEKTFTEMTRILRNKGSMVLTLANRRVDNKEVPLVEITKKLASIHGLELIQTLNRNIHNKRMPSRVSSIKDHGSVKSMSKETVLTFKKQPQLST